MGNLKLFVVAFMMLISSATYAYQEVVFSDEAVVSSEIENLLNNSGIVVADDFTVVVFFSLSDDKKIQSFSVASPDPRVNDFLQKRFENQSLTGDKWHPGKIYELSVKKQVLGRRS